MRPACARCSSRKRPPNCSWKKPPSSRIWATCCVSWNAARGAGPRPVAAAHAGTAADGAAQHDAALELLNDPQLLERILADYQRCGLVGEETNKLVCYLACVSRHLPRPLSVLIQSSSASGKTSLVDATLAFMPAEAQIRLSALTGQSLYYGSSQENCNTIEATHGKEKGTDPFCAQHPAGRSGKRGLSPFPLFSNGSYMGRTELQHKILAVAEEEGVSEAAYALKLLQSEARLAIASAGKDSETGRQQTQHYEVEGPVALLLTTTAEEPDAELANRCLVLSVKEQPAQTAAIHQRQRAAAQNTIKSRRRKHFHGQPAA